MKLYTYDVEITVKAESELEAEMEMQKMAEETEFELGIYQLSHSSPEKEEVFEVKSFEKFLEAIDHEQGGNYYTFDVELTLPALSEIKAEMKM